MNDLLNEKLFSLLTESSQVTKKEMQSAYECFMEQIKIVSQTKESFSEVFRMLNIARIELAFIQTLYRYEEGKKYA